MTPEEKAKKIAEIYNEAAEKLEALGKERKEIMGRYIKDLEEQKIKAVRDTLEGAFNK